MGGRGIRSLLVFREEGGWGGGREEGSGVAGGRESEAFWIRWTWECEEGSRWKFGRLKWFRLGYTVLHRLPLAKGIITLSGSFCHLNDPHSLLLHTASTLVCLSLLLLKARRNAWLLRLVLTDPWPLRLIAFRVVSLRQVFLGAKRDEGHMSGGVERCAMTFALTPSADTTWACLRFVVER